MHYLHSKCQEIVTHQYSIISQKTKIPQIKTAIFHSIFFKTVDLLNNLEMCNYYAT